MASVLTLDYLKVEVSKGRRDDFNHFMSMVSDAHAQRVATGCNCSTYCGEEAAYWND